MQENTGFQKTHKSRERFYQGPKPKQNEGRTWQRPKDKRKHDE